MIDIQQEVAKYEPEILEQTDNAINLAQTLKEMGDVGEIDSDMILDSLGVLGLRLVPMDNEKNIASLAFFNSVLGDK